MKFIIALALFLCLNITAEDKYAKKGEGWKTWETFLKHVMDNDRDKAIQYTEGELKANIEKEGIESFQVELKREKITFVREFKGLNKNKANLYLVVTNKNNEHITMVLKKDKNWTIFDIKMQNLKNPQDVDKVQDVARVRAKTARVKSNLKNIGTGIATYFADGAFSTYPEKFEDMEIAKEILTYDHPETGKKHKFLFLKLAGQEFQGSSQYITAITDVKIMGKYYAVFEDAHVDSISDEDFEKHKVLLGLKKPALKKVNYSEKEQKEMTALIKQLGAQKFKERKAAKTALKKMGEKIVPFLTENLKQDDFEITVSLKELIEALSPKKFDGERPKVN